MILVDTSAWLDFFGDRRPPVPDQVDQILAGEEPAITGLIYTELLQGASWHEEYQRVKRLFQRIRILWEPQAIWDTAGHLSLLLGKKGVTVKTVDLVIAAMAMEFEIPLLTSDSDFRLIASKVPLVLYPG